MNRNFVALFDPPRRSTRHVDPSKFSLEELSRVRGAMWTRRWSNARYGPRPGQPTNILAMDYYEYYPPDERKDAIKAYREPGYTHAVTGPMMDAGYHGIYPTTDILRDGQPLWDMYLDAMQEWWDDGIIPIHFIHPDGWSLEDMRALAPYYRQPRAQRLLRFVVPPGWEPTKYDWPNAYWNAILDEWHATMPNAIIAAHTVNDVDALTGGGDDHSLGPNGNAVCWQRTCQRLHIWLIQNAGYWSRDTDPYIWDRNDLMWPSHYASHRANLAGYFQDLRNRFEHNYAGWPTYSLYGSDVPIKRVRAEEAAYPDFWQDWPESEAQSLSDLAMANGANGYLDGGTVDVP